MEFSDFLLSCDNDEMLHIYLGKDMTHSTFYTLGKCEEFITNESLSNMTVNKFFTLCDSDSYLCVFLLPDNEFNRKVKCNG